MNSWQLWIMLISITCLSGWIPSLALYILDKREVPIIPAFLCASCHKATLRCHGCKHHLRKKKWIVCMLFLSTMVSGMTQINGFERIVFICLLLFLFLISLIDIWSMLIPNKITLPSACFFLLLRFFFHPYPFSNYILTAVISLGILFLIGCLTRGMGGGDAKLLTVCGLVLGWPATLLAFWIATMSALLFVGLRSVYHPVKRQEAFPFGPHIAVGCYLAYVWGEYVITWYLHLISLT